jgi:uncharacterized repeat protein (TIGR03803 family)
LKAAALGLAVCLSLVPGTSLAQTYSTYTDLHDFGGTVVNSNGKSGPDGANPYAGVTFDGEGNMYGTTSFSGPNAGGLVWEVTNSGVYKDLHDFGGTIVDAEGKNELDGIGPNVVTIDSKGNLYGTTYSGGPNDVSTNIGGMVWEVTAAGVYRDLHDFGGTVVNADGKSGLDGTGPAGSVTFNSKGNLYGTTEDGGEFGSGVVWEITTAGVYNDLHDFGGMVINANGKNGADGTGPEAGPTFDSQGNMYGTTAGGGPNDFIGGGIVWEIKTAGAYKDLHDFGGTVVNANGESGPDGFQSEAEVTLDSTGNLYGTTESGGLNYEGIVWEITTAGAYKDLHDFGGTVVNANGESGPDGHSPIAAVKFDGSGNMYGTSVEGGPNGGYGNGMAWEMTKTGTYKDLHDFGGTVVNADGKSGPDGASPEAGVNFDSEGNMYGTAFSGGANGENEGGYGDGMVWKLSLLVPPPGLRSASLAQSSVIGGSSTTGTVTLSTAAPTGGTTVTLSSNSADATVPATVKVAAGATTGTFTVKTSTVTANVSAVITAKLGSVSKTATLTVEPLTLSSLSLSPTAVTGGTSTTGTITLDGPAPVATAVALSSSSPDATVLPTVTIPAAATTATFQVKTSSVTANTSAIITAKLGTVTKTESLQIDILALSSLSLSPTTVTGGTPSTGTVTLNGAAPKATTVTLSSNSIDATTPSTVTVLAGETTATFSVKSPPVAANASAVITAKLGTVSKTATLTVDAPVLSTFTLSSVTVVGRSDTVITGTLTLSGPPTSAGATITLKSSNPAAASLPATAYIHSGNTSVKFTVTHSAVQATSTVSLTATCGGVTKTVTLTVTP